MINEKTPPFSSLHPDTVALLLRRQRELATKTKRVRKRKGEVTTRHESADTGAGAYEFGRYGHATYAR